MEGVTRIARIRDRQWWLGFDCESARSRDERRRACRENIRGREKIRSLDAGTAIEERISRVRLGLAKLANANRRRAVRPTGQA